MKTINKIKTPIIGDLITFTNVWDRVISKSNKYMSGFILGIVYGILIGIFIGICLSIYLLEMVP